MSTCPSLEGWLMKQKHGLCRTWSRRYFVLEDRTLAYYHQKDDPSPQQVLDLTNYSLTFKRHTRRQCTFALTADHLPSYYLQAEDEDELDRWVHHLKQHLGSNGSVLDKWLERLEITAADSSCPTLPLPQQASTSMLSSKSGPGQLQPQHPPVNTLHSHRSMESISTFASLPHRVSFTNDRRPSTQSTHSNKSASSHATSYTAHTTFSNFSYPCLASASPTTTNTTQPASIAMAASPTPSHLTQPLTNHASSGKFFPALFFSSRKQKQDGPLASVPMGMSATAPGSSLASPAPPSLASATLPPGSPATPNFTGHAGGSMDDIDPMMQVTGFSTSSSSSSIHSGTLMQNLAAPIIHPSEYNHDDDPHERFLLRQRQKQQKQDLPYCYPSPALQVDASS
ncbi:hypothetical protein DM01DRAFT_1381172 [Hesseltinella vesiculosa]|uniref:PH domain-containing protein n=1 Tax=Hesseltinella vesiculosa TaxID=101127 RepID=A0A1X2GRB0_9FUNG|nr:hypothetical protein DM01DRAFT_1381172 [Hesseltinella vesiculosa]